MDLRGRGIYSGYPNRHKCIFIHIPKAAGTSVTQALFGPVSRHVPYFEYEQANHRKFQRYFKFAFVRNPWDRLVSTYFFLKRGGLNEMDCQWAEQNLSGYDDFDSFVRGWVTEENVWSWVHFKPQHFFICDNDMNLMMDFVGRMESLVDDFSFVAKRLGCDVRLEVINKSDHEHYSKYYTDETIRIVERVYKKDIRTFNYKFVA
jgi:hypothetical protein